MPQQIAVPSASWIMVAIEMSVSLEMLGFLFREFQREFLKQLLVFAELMHMLLHESFIMPALVDHVFRDGAQPDEIRALFRTDEQIGAFRHFMLAQIGYDQLLAMQLVGAFDPRRQHGMAFRRARSRSG